MIGVCKEGERRCLLCATVTDWEEGGAAGETATATTFARGSRLGKKGRKILLCEWYNERVFSFPLLLAIARARKLCSIGTMGRGEAPCN